MKKLIFAISCAFISPNCLAQIDSTLIKAAMPCVYLGYVKSNFYNGARGSSSCTLSFVKYRKKYYLLTCRHAVDKNMIESKMPLGQVEDSLTIKLFDYKDEISKLTLDIDGFRGLEKKSLTLAGDTDGYFIEIKKPKGVNIKTIDKYFLYPDTNKYIYKSSFVWSFPYTSYTYFDVISNKHIQPRFQELKYLGQDSTTDNLFETYYFDDDSNLAGASSGAPIFDVYQAKKSSKQILVYGGIISRGNAYHRAFGINRYAIYTLFKRLAN